MMKNRCGNMQLNNKTSSLDSNCLQYRGVITGDLNNLNIVPGIYMIGAYSSVSNIPDGTAYCVFIQFPYYKVQMIICGEGIGVKTRKHTGNPEIWKPWL